MKKNITTKWVKALRSGEYKQGYDRLQNPETKGYCCLGVLCKVYEEETSNQMRNTLLNDEDLPFDVMKDFQVSNSTCRQAKAITIGKKNYDSLAGANDNHESFANIANWIEKNYALL